MSSVNKPKKHAQQQAAGRKGAAMRRNPRRKTIQADRQRRILQWQLEGVPQKEIARRLGIGQSRVCVLHQQALSEVHGDIETLGLKFRKQELARSCLALERITKVLLNADLKVQTTTEAGDVMEVRDFEVLKAMANSLKGLSEHVARLAGANMPIKVEQTGPGRELTEAELLARLKERESHG